MMEPNGLQKNIVHGTNMNKTLRYFISLCFSVVVLWYGIHGMKAAEYMIIFLTWLGVLVCFIANNNQKIRSKVLEEGRPVSVWISTPITVAFIIIFLYYGWIWTAFGYFMSMSLCYELYEPLKVCQKED